MTSHSPPTNDLATQALHLQATKLFQVSAYAFMLYDYCLTFAEEVERIWRSKVTGAVILFLMNRYIPILQFIIIINAYNDPRWSKMACQRFVVFEGASSVAMIAVTEIIMILRVYAIYNRNRLILVFLLVIWVFQIIFSAIGLRGGFALDLPPDLVGCILTGHDAMMASIWITPLITNSIMFFLTLYRSWKWNIETHHSAPIVHVLVRDGTIYFLVIFMANLLNTLIFMLASEDLKVIGAAFSQLITNTMISRLVLNLRSASDLTSRSTQPATETLGDRVVGPLGDVLETFLDTQGMDEDEEMLEGLFELSTPKTSYRIMYQ